MMRGNYGGDVEHSCLASGEWSSLTVIAKAWKGSCEVWRFVGAPYEPN